MACSDLSVQDEGAVYRLGKARDLSMINTWNTEPVGVSLLAIAAFHSTVMLSDT
jgi:hypothetical protein